MENIEDKIKEFCKEHKAIFVYLFGSFAENRQYPNSDLDIAIYLEDSDEVCLAKINSELSKSLKTDKVDIIILNKASIFMQFKIIQKGKLIYCHDELNRIRYEAKIMSLYFDRQYYYRRHIEKNLERIAQRGIL